MKIWICRDMDDTLWMSEGEPYLDEEKGEWNFRSGNYMLLSKEKYHEVTLDNSPSEVEIIEKSTLDEVYKGLDQYENFLGMVACMRRAQKEANDMIAQVECYEEAMEHVKKAEELESMVDKWLEGEAL